MSETRISKIQVRRGNIVDLPLLDAGEFGYALDEQRLFIGNPLTNIGTGNGSTATFAMPNLSEYPAGLAAEGYRNPTFYIDGQEMSGVEINGATAVFSVAPDAGQRIDAKWNSEVQMRTAEVAPGEERLDRLSTQGTPTEFQFDKDVYSAVFMNYTLRKNQTAVITGTEKNAVANIGDDLTINGVTINFTTDANSNGFASIEDIVLDINTANIVNLTASNEDGYLKLEVAADDLVISGSALQDVGMVAGTYLGTAEVESNVNNPIVRGPNSITINGTEVKFLGDSVDELVTAINDKFQGNSTIYAVEEGNRLGIYSEVADLVVDGDLGLSEVGIAAGTYPIGQAVQSRVSTSFEMIKEGDSIFVNGRTVTFADTTMAGIIDTINSVVSDLDIVATPHPEHYYGVELTAYGTVPTVTTDIRNINNLYQVADVQSDGSLVQTDLDIRINKTLIEFNTVGEDDIFTIEDAVAAINAANATTGVTASIENNEIKLVGNSYNDDIILAAGDVTVKLSSSEIVNITNENPATVTTNGAHGLTGGSQVEFYNVPGALGDLLNNNTYIVSNVTSTEFTIDVNLLNDPRVFYNASDAQVTGNLHNPRILQADIDDQTISIGDGASTYVDVTFATANANPSSGDHDITSMLEAINTAFDGSDLNIQATNVNNKIRLTGSNTNIHITANGDSSETLINVDFIEPVVHPTYGAGVALVTTNGTNGFAHGSAFTINGVLGLTDMNGNTYYADTTSNAPLGGALLASQFYVFSDQALTNPLTIGVAEYEDAQVASEIGSVDFTGRSSTAMPIASLNPSLAIESWRFDEAPTSSGTTVEFATNDTLAEVVDKINAANIEGVEADAYLNDGAYNLRLRAVTGYEFDVILTSSSAGDLGDAIGYLGLTQGTKSRNASGTVNQGVATLLGFSIGTTEGLLSDTTAVDTIGEKEYFSQATTDFETNGLLELGLTAGVYIREAGNNITLQDNVAGTLEKLGITEYTDSNLDTLADQPYVYEPSNDIVVIDTPVVEHNSSLTFDVDGVSPFTVAFNSTVESPATLEKVAETLNAAFEDEAPESGIVADTKQDNNGIYQLRITADADFEITASAGSVLVDLGLEGGPFNYVEEVIVRAWGVTTFGQGSRDLQAGDEITIEFSDSTTDVIPVSRYGTDLDDVVNAINDSLTASQRTLEASAGTGTETNHIVFEGTESIVSIVDNQAGQVLTRLGITGGNLAGQTNYVAKTLARVTGTRSEATLEHGTQVTIQGELITFEAVDSDVDTTVTLAEAVDQINAVMYTLDSVGDVRASIRHSQLRLTGIRTDITVDAFSSEDTTVSIGISAAGGTVTSDSAHGLQTGEVIFIDNGIGYKTVEVKSATTFTLPSGTDGDWADYSFVRRALSDLSLETLAGNTFIALDYYDANKIGDNITPVVSTNNFWINGVEVENDGSNFTLLPADITGADSGAGITNITVEDSTVLKIHSNTSDIIIGGTALDDLGIIAGTYNVTSAPASIVGSVINPTLTPGTTVTLDIPGDINTGPTVIEVPTKSLADLVEAINAGTDGRAEIVSTNFGVINQFGNNDTMFISDTATSNEVSVDVLLPRNARRSITTSIDSDLSVGVGDTFDINGITVRMLATNPSATTLVQYVNDAFFNTLNGPYTYIEPSAEAGELVLTSVPGVNIIIDNFNSGDIVRLKSYLGLDNVIVDELNALVDNINTSLTDEGLTDIVASKVSTPNGYQLKLQSLTTESIEVRYQTGLLEDYVGIPAATYDADDLNIQPAEELMVGFTIVGTDTDIAISTDNQMLVLSFAPEQVTNAVLVNVNSTDDVETGDYIRLSALADTNLDVAYRVSKLSATQLRLEATNYDNFSFSEFGTILVVDDTTDSAETLLEELGIAAGYYNYTAGDTASVIGSIVDPTITGCHGLEIGYGLPDTPGSITTRVLFTSGRELENIIDDINRANTGVTANSQDGRLLLTADNAITIRSIGSSMQDIGFDYDVDNNGLVLDYHSKDATAGVTSRHPNNWNTPLTPGAITINGVIVGFTGTSLADVVDDINAASIAGVSARSQNSMLQIQGTDTDLQIGLDEGEANVKLGITQGHYPAGEGAPAVIESRYNPDVTRGDDMVLTVNGVEHRIVATGDTLASFISDINSAGIEGVTASNNLNKLRIEGSEADLILINGQEETIRITDIQVGPAGVITVTSPAHGFITNQRVVINNVGGMVELNDRTFFVTVSDIDNFVLNGVDGSGYTPFAPSEDARVVGDVVNPLVSDNDIVGITTSAGDSRQIQFNDTTFGLDLDGIVDTINNAQIPNITASEENNQLVIVGEGVDITLSAQETTALVTDVELKNTATIIGTESVTTIPQRQSLTINGVRTVAARTLLLEELVNTISGKNISGVEVTATLDNQIAIVSTDVNVEVGQKTNSIESITVLGSTATVTTTNNHQLESNDIVVIDDVNVDFNKTFTITVTGFDTFTLQTNATGWASVPSTSGVAVTPDTALTTLGLVAVETPVTNNIITVTAPSHGFATGDRIRFGDVATDDFQEIDNQRYSVFVLSVDQFQLYTLGTTDFVDGFNYNVDDFSPAVNAEVVSQVYLMIDTESFSINDVDITATSNWSVADIKDEINRRVTGVNAIVTPVGNLVLASATTDINIQPITESRFTIHNIEVAGGETLVVTVDGTIGVDLHDGDFVRFENTQGTTGLNEGTYKVNVLNNTSFEVLGANLDDFVQYTTGGTVTASPLVNLGIVPGIYEYTPAIDPEVFGQTEVTDSSANVTTDGYDLIINGTTVEISATDSTGADLIDVVASITDAGISGVGAEIVTDNSSNESIRIFADDRDLHIERGANSQSVDITDIDRSNPVRVIAPGNEFNDDEYIFIDNVEGMTELNGNRYQVINKGGIGYTPAVNAKIVANISNADFRNGLQFTITDDSAGSATLTLDDEAAHTTTTFGDAGSYTNNSVVSINDIDLTLTTTSTVTGTVDYTYDSALADDFEFSISNGTTTAVIDFGAGATTLAGIISIINTKLDIEGIQDIVATDADGGTGFGSSDKLRLTGTNVDITIAESDSTDSSGTLADFGLVAGTTTATLDINSVVTDINTRAGSLVSASETGGELKIELDTETPVTITSSTDDLATYIGIPQNTVIANAVDVVADINDNGSLGGLVASLDSEGRLVIDGLPTHDFTLEIASSDTIETVDISNISTTNPARVRSIEHGLTDGEMITITGVAGMTEVNDRVFSANVFDENTFDLYEIIAGETFDKTKADNMPSVGEILPVNSTNFTPYTPVDPIRVSGTVVGAVLDEFQNGVDMTMIINGKTVTFDQPPHNLATAVIDINNAGIPGVTPFVDAAQSFSISGIKTVPGENVEISTTVPIHNIGVGDIVTLANISGTTELNDNDYVVDSVPSSNVIGLSVLAAPKVSVEAGDEFTIGYGDTTSTTVSFTETTDDVDAIVTAINAADDSTSSDNRVVASNENGYLVLTATGADDILLTDGTGNPLATLFFDTLSSLYDAGDSVNDVTYASLTNNPTIAYSEYTSGGDVQTQERLVIQGVGVDITIAEDADSSVWDSTITGFRTVDITDISNTVGIDDLGFTDGQSADYAEPFVAMLGTENDPTLSDGDQLSINGVVVTFNSPDNLSTQGIVDKINNTGIIGVSAYIERSFEGTRIYELLVDSSSTTLAIMTDAGHGLSTGDEIIVDGAGTSADGTYTVTVIDADTFSLDGTLVDDLPEVAGTYTSTEYLVIKSTGTTADLIIDISETMTQLGLAASRAGDTFSVAAADKSSYAAAGVTTQDQTFAVIDSTPGLATTTTGQQIVVNGTLVEFRAADVVSPAMVAQRITDVVAGVTATAITDDSTSADDDVIRLTGDADIDLVVNASTQVTVTTDGDHGFTSGLTIEISGVEGLTAINSYNNGIHKINHGGDGTDRFVLTGFVIDENDSSYDSTYEGYTASTGIIKSSPLINLGLVEGTTVYTPNGTATIDAITSLGLVEGVVEHTADIDPMYVGLTAEPEVLPGSDIRINGELIVFQNTDSTIGDDPIVDVNEIIAQIDTATSGDPDFDATAQELYTPENSQNIEGVELLSSGLVQITVPAHGYTSGDVVRFDDIIVEGLEDHGLNWTQGTVAADDDREFTITVVDADTFTLDGTDDSVYNDVEELPTYDIEIVKQAPAQNIIVRTQTIHELTTGSARINGLTTPSELNYANGGVYEYTRLSDYELELLNTSSTRVDLRVHDKAESGSFVIYRDPASSNIHVELADHNLDTGNFVMFRGLDISTELNHVSALDNIYAVRRIDDNEFELIDTNNDTVTFYDNDSSTIENPFEDDNNVGELVVVYGGVSQTDSTGLGEFVALSGVVQKKLTHVKITSNNSSLIIALGEQGLEKEIVGIDNNNRDGLIEVYTNGNHYLHTGDVVSFGDIGYEATSGLDNTSNWIITVTGDNSFTIGTPGQGFGYPRYLRNPSVVANSLFDFSNATTRVNDDIIINGTTIELDNVSLFDAIAQINDSDASGVEADTVQRLRIDSIGEDKTISLEHFVAEVAGIRINVDDNEVLIITESAHGFFADDTVTISGVVGTTRANGTWTVGRSIHSKGFTIVPTDGSDFADALVLWNTYTSGGTATSEDTLAKLGLDATATGGVTATSDLTDRYAMISTLQLDEIEIRNGCKFVLNGNTVRVTGTTVSAINQAVQSALSTTTDLVTVSASQYLRITSYGSDLTLSTTNDSAADDVAIDGIYLDEIANVVYVKATRVDEDSINIGHGLATGNTVQFYDIAGADELNKGAQDKTFKISVVDEYWFTIDDVNVENISRYIGNARIEGTAVSPDFRRGDDISINGTLVPLGNSTISSVANDINNASLDGVFARVGDVGNLIITSIGQDLELARGSDSRITSIEDISRSNPVLVTAPGHAMEPGMKVIFEDVQGMVQLNYESNGGVVYTIGSTSANTFTLDGVNSTGYNEYIEGENAVVTGAYTNPVVYSGHAFEVNETEVVISGTTIDDVVSSINGANIPGVFAENIAGQVRITGTDTDIEVFDTENGLQRLVEGATATNPMVLTVPTHGLRTGEEIDVGRLAGMAGFGTGGDYTVTVIDENRFSLDTSEGASFTPFAREEDPTITASIAEPRIALDGHNLFINNQEVTFTSGAMSSIVANINNAGIEGVSARNSTGRLQILGNDVDITIADSDGSGNSVPFIETVVGIEEVFLENPIRVVTSEQHGLIATDLVRIEELAGVNNVNGAVFRVGPSGLSSTEFTLHTLEDNLPVDGTDSTYGEYQNTTNATLEGTVANPRVRFNSSISINGQDLVFNKGTAYIDEVVDRINTSLTTNLVDYITAYEVGGVLYLESDTSTEGEEIIIRGNTEHLDRLGLTASIASVTSTAPFTALSPTGSGVVSDGETIVINGTTVTVVGTTLQQVVDSINNASIAGIEASYTESTSSSKAVTGFDTSSGPGQEVIVEVTGHGFASGDYISFESGDSTLDYDSTDIGTVYEVREISGDADRFKLVGTDSSTWTWDSSATTVVRQEYTVTITATGYNLTVIEGSMDLNDLNLVAGTYYVAVPKTIVGADLNDPNGVETGTLVTINDVNILFSSSIEATLDNVIESINTQMTAVGVDITASDEDSNGKLNLEGGPQTPISIDGGSISARSLVEDIVIDTADEIILHITRDVFVDGGKVVLENVLGAEILEGEYYVKTFPSTSEVQLFEDPGLTSAASVPTDYNDADDEFATIGIMSTDAFENADVAGESFSFTIGTTLQDSTSLPYTINVDATHDIDDVVNTINSASIEGVRARKVTTEVDGGDYRLQILGHGVDGIEISAEDATDLANIGLSSGRFFETVTATITRSVLADLGLEIEFVDYTPSGKIRSNALIGLGFTDGQAADYTQPSYITIPSVITLNRIGLSQGTTTHVPSGDVVHEALFELGLSEVTVPHLSSGFIETHGLMNIGLTEGTTDFNDSALDTFTIEPISTVKRLGLETLFNTFELKDTDGTDYVGYLQGGIAVKDALSDLGITPGLYPFVTASEARADGDVYGENDSVSVVPGDSIIIGNNIETNGVYRETEVFFSGSSLDEVVRNINDTMTAGEYTIVASNFDGQLRLVGTGSDITIREGNGTAMRDLGFRIPLGQDRAVYRHWSDSFATKSVLNELGLESRTYEYVPWGDAVVDSNALEGLGFTTEQVAHYRRTNAYVSGSVTNPKVTTENFQINGETVSLSGKTIAEIVADVNNAGIPGISATDDGGAIEINSVNTNILLSEGTAYVPTSTPAEVIGTNENPLVVANQVLSINGTDVTTSGGDLFTVINDINAANIPGISASSLNNRLRISGNGTDIIISGSGSNPIALSALGLASGTTPHTPSRPGTLGVLFPVGQWSASAVASTVGSRQQPQVWAPDHIIINNVKVPFTGTTIDDVIADIDAADVFGIEQRSKDFLGIKANTTINVAPWKSSIATITVDQDSGVSDMGVTAGRYTSNIGIVNGTKLQPSVSGNLYINDIEVDFGTLTPWNEVVDVINDRMISASQNVVAFDNVGYVRLVAGNGTGNVDNSVTVGSGDYGTALTDLGLTRHNVVATGSAPNATYAVGDTIVINGTEVVFTGTTASQVAADITNTVPNVDGYLTGSSQVQIIGRGRTVNIAVGNRNILEISTNNPHELVPGQSVAFEDIHARVSVTGTVDADTVGLSANSNFMINGVEIVADSAENFATAITNSTDAALLGVTANVVAVTNYLHIESLTGSIVLSDGTGTPLALLGVTEGTYIPDATGIEMLNNTSWTVSRLVDATTFVVDNVPLTLYTDYGSGGTACTKDVMVDLGLIRATDTELTVTANPDPDTGVAEITGHYLVDPTTPDGAALSINGQKVLLTTENAATGQVELSGMVNDINLAFANSSVTARASRMLVLEGTGVDIDITGSGTWRNDLGLGSYEFPVARTAELIGNVVNPTSTIPPSIFIDGEEVFFTVGEGGIATAENIAESINLAVALAIANTGGTQNPSPLTFISASVSNEGKLQIRKTGGAGATVLTLAPGQTVTSNILEVFGMSLSAASAGGQRMGQLRFMVEPGADAFSIDDQYNLSTNDVDLTFSAKFEDGLFILTYENAEAVDVTFNYTFDLWKT